MQEEAGAKRNDISKLYLSLKNTYVHHFTPQYTWFTDIYKHNIMPYALNVHIYYIASVQ